MPKNPKNNISENSVTENSAALLMSRSCPSTSLFFDDSREIFCQNSKTTSNFDLTEQCKNLPREDKLLVNLRLAKLQLEAANSEKCVLQRHLEESHQQNARLWATNRMFSKEIRGLNHRLNSFIRRTNKENKLQIALKTATIELETALDEKRKAEQQHFELIERMRQDERDLQNQLLNMRLEFERLMGDKNERRIYRERERPLPPLQNLMLNCEEGRKLRKVTLPDGDYFIHCESLPFLHWSVVLCGPKKKCLTVVENLCMSKSAKFSLVNNPLSINEDVITNKTVSFQNSLFRRDCLHMSMDNDRRFRFSRYKSKMRTEASTLTNFSAAFELFSPPDINETRNLLNNNSIQEKRNERKGAFRVIIRCTANGEFIRILSAFRSPLSFITKTEDSNATVFLFEPSLQYIERIRARFPPSGYYNLRLEGTNEHIVTDENGRLTLDKTLKETFQLDYIEGGNEDGGFFTLFSLVQKGFICSEGNTLLVLPIDDKSEEESLEFAANERSPIAFFEFFKLYSNSDSVPRVFAIRLVDQWKFLTTEKKSRNIRLTTRELQTLKLKFVPLKPMYDTNQQTAFSEDGHKNS